MLELFRLALAFACGGFVGFIAAAFFAVGKRADAPDEFDGGFSATNPPPVRTVIWHPSVKGKDQ